jgi:hypothetical protein
VVLKMDGQQRVSSQNIKVKAINIFTQVSVKT